MTIKKIKDSNGVEHAIDYNALENKPTYWTGWIVLSPNTTKLEKQSIMEIDMTSHLPNDGHVYSCAIQVRFGCSGGAGLYASSDLTIDSTATSYLIYRGLGNSSTLGGQCQVFVGPGRKLYLHNSSPYDACTSVYTVMTNYFRVS